MKLIIFSVFMSCIPGFCFSQSLETLSSELGQALTDTPNIKIAVLDFPYTNGKRSEGGAIVQERLTTHLAKNRRVTLIERNLISKVMAEMKLQMSGIVNESEIKNLGKLLGADAVLTGTMNKLSQDNVEINARIIDVETGRILASGRAEVRKTWNDLLFDLQSASVGEVAFGATVRSDIPNIQIGAASTQEFNITAEELRDKVKDAQRNRGVLPAERTERWCALAAIKDGNPYLKEAERACMEWKGYEIAYSSALKDFALDFAKLARYLDLERSVEQKQALISMFLNKYEGWYIDWPSVFGGKYNVVKNMLDMRLIPGNKSIPHFFIDIYEVSATNYWDVYKGKGNYSQMQPELANHPVTDVTYEDAKQYCEKIGKRLPTSEEWAWAQCKMPDSIDDYGWYWENHKKDKWKLHTHPVGQKKANCMGLYDMIGNAAEWVVCNQCQAPPTFLDLSVQTYYQETCGGSWRRRGNKSSGCDTTKSLYYSILKGKWLNYTSPDIGFRCAMSFPNYN